MNPAEFIAKWSRADLSERSAAQQHFLDLCDLFEHPKPAEVDPAGDWFTFEKGAAKHGGGDGWADVWKRGFFAWEYKRAGSSLDRAYDQLLKYREALEKIPGHVFALPQRRVPIMKVPVTDATGSLSSWKASPRTNATLRVIFVQKHRA